MADSLDDKTLTSDIPGDSTVVKQRSDEYGLALGMVLKNRFILESVLGKGGMGTIFKARDRLKDEMEDNKPYVAIKVLHTHLQNNTLLVKALQREARKSQELSHPNIVNVHDFDRTERHVFMVMEFLHGSPLDVLINNKKLVTMPIYERWGLIQKIATGLAFAHQKKVIHYDIKPANIFVCDDGNIKILDFGIAKAMRTSTETDMTVFDQFSPDALTPAYASCEMLRWETPDERDDIYAFGCVAFEILTGHHPFNKMPALQAWKNDLQPEAIQGISKNQWQAIRSTLKFDRSERTETISLFIDTAFNKPIKKKPRIALLFTFILLLTTTTVVILNRSNRNDEFPPEHRTNPLTSEEQEKIKRLLEIADMHMAVQRAVQPEGSSALDAYQRVLKIDPTSRPARQGVTKAMKICKKEIHRYLEDNNRQNAKNLAEFCLRARPGDRSLQKLKTQI